MRAAKTPRLRGLTIVLAALILVPAVVFIGLSQEQQQAAWMGEARRELETRTELLQSLDPAGSAVLAVHGRGREQVAPLTARARDAPAAEATEVAGVPHLVSSARLWTNGPVLVVARDVGAAGGSAFGRSLGTVVVAMLGVPAAALATFAWLVIGNQDHRGPRHGSETAMDDRNSALASPNGAPGFAQLMGAVRKMATALDGAEAKRVTERRERDILEGSLRRTQVGVAVRQLTDAMAHEIGSPLNTILGRARLGAARPDCPAEIRAALETIAVQAERIRQLVEEMLRVTRPERLQTGVCDLAAVAEQVIAAIEAECERANVPMTLERQADSAYVGVNEERAFQIVVNACLSAVEAQPDGGNVTLRIRAEDRGSPSGRHILLEVEDQGRTPAEAPDAAGLSGISSAIDARGFSLMIARGLVVEAGGLFELRPGARGGAVCQFTFPGGGAAALSPQASPAPSMERTT